MVVLLPATIARYAKQYAKLPQIDPSVKTFVTAIRFAAEAGVRLAQEQAAAQTVAAASSPPTTEPSTPAATLQFGVHQATSTPASGSGSLSPDDTPETTIEDIEMRFLSALTLDILVAAIPVAPVWSWTRDLITRLFADRIPVNHEQAVTSLRIGTALARRLVEVDLTEIPNADQEFSDLHAATLATASRSRRQVIEQSEAPTVADSAMSNLTGNNHGFNAHPAVGGRNQIIDLTRIRRTVQSHFYDSHGERAKFTGDLSKAPSYHLWESRLRTVLRDLGLSESQKVTMLSEALADPALTFYYRSIVPDDARSGDSLAEAAQQLQANLSPNVPTLSGALAKLRQHFCTDAARNVLKQELDQLRLSHIERDEQVSKPIALSLLKDRIFRLSSNGPPEFRSETCMIAALRKCLSDGREEWAASSLIAATDKASSNVIYRTLEHYVQTLVSYLREMETLTGTLPGGRPRTSPAIPGMMYAEDQQHDAFYGYENSRANPRRTRVTYQNLQTGDQRRHDPSRPRTGFPNGMELRGMLMRPSQNTTGSSALTSNRGTPAPAQRLTAGMPQRLCYNCDQPGHLRRDCPKPLRPRVDVARAMYNDNVPPELISILMAQEADSCHNTQLSSPTASINTATSEQTQLHTAMMTNAQAPSGDSEPPIPADEEKAHAWDTMLATLSRETHPGTDFC